MRESKHHQKKQQAPKAQKVALPPFSKATWPLYLRVALHTLRSLIYYGVGLALILLAFGVGLLGGYFASIINDTAVPTKAEMTRTLANVDTSTQLFYANNQSIGHVKSDLLRDTVSLDKVSPWLQKAIVATEDEDFWTNHGVVPKALIRAVFAEVTGLGSQTGGSTLTQQVVKLQFLNSQTTFKRKAVEIMYALRLNHHYSKARILEEYLNIITLGRNHTGQNIAGVETAALGLFGKHAKDLNLAESAYIAGLPQSPSVYTPYTNTGAFKSDLSAGFNREKTVLFRMYRAGTITKAEYDEAKAFDLKAALLTPGNAESTVSSDDYVYTMVQSEAQTILAQQLAKADGYTKTQLEGSSSLTQTYDKDASKLLATKGYQVHSTLNKPIYDAMQKVVANYKGSFGYTYTGYVKDSVTGGYTKTSAPVQNGTVLLDNQTGAILGFVGGTAGQVNHIYTKRSPGSSIKPTLVYGPAIDSGIISSRTMLADFKKDFGGGYSVTDYGNTILNKFVDATTALKNSLNIPTVNLYQELRKSVDVKAYMTKMGVTTLTDNDYATLGLALGGTDYGETVQEAASAFATFARGGSNVSPYVIDRIEDPSGKVIYQHKTVTRHVFSKATAYILTLMLHQTVTSGTGIYAGENVNFNASNLIAKTGTSNDYKDLWFIGSTPGITMASWMGYDNANGANHTLSSSGSAINQRYWAALANAVYALDPKLFALSDTMQRPSAVKSTTVNAETGLKNGDVTYNGKTFSLTGSTAEALSYGYTPGVTQAQFGIGGTTANYTDFWASLQGGNDDSYGQKKSGDEANQTDAAKADEANSSSSSSAASSSSTAPTTTEANQ